MSPACAQAITDHRARLSNAYSSDPLQMDEQNIVMNGTNNTVICPSNGYTFQRTPTQARAGRNADFLQSTAPWRFWSPKPPSASLSFVCLSRKTYPGSCMLSEAKARQLDSLMSAFDAVSPSCSFHIGIRFPLHVLHASLHSERRLDLSGSGWDLFPLCLFFDGTS